MNAPNVDPGIWTENFKIHSYEVGLSRRATLETVCRYFQEAAWNHAEALGVGYSQLRRQNRIWVLSRLLVKVEHYPRWAETVTIRTWPRAAKSIFAMRDFELFDCGGTRLGAATSAWLVLDAVTRRAQRAADLLSSVKTSRNRPALDQEPQKLASCEETSLAATIAVRYSDLDLNGHVNNTRYIGWILDSYPVDFHQAYTVRRFEINFLDEANAGETVSIVSRQTAPGEHCHSILKSGGAEDLCRARVKWVANQG